MSRIINRVIKQYLGHRMGRIERFMQAPERTQESVLQQLLHQARHTAFGRQYEFSSIRDATTFAQRVPTHDYEALKPHIQRMMRGERDVLWPGRINWYSKSSGTTHDKSKFLPVPPQNLRNNHLAGAWHALALLHHHRPHLHFFGRKTLLLPGSHSAFQERPEVRTGDISAVMTAHIPGLIRPFFVPDQKTLLEPDFEVKLTRIAEIAARDPHISTLSGAPAWMVVLLRRILEQTGRRNLLDVWPHLQLFMHGGMGFEPYRPLFRRMVPDGNFLSWDTYNASEGYFGTQYEPDRPDILLLLDLDIFYEFVPRSEWEKEQPHTVGIGEVEIGEDYALVISSSNGLWRYLPGDTLRFTRKYPHCFQLTGRTKQFINTFGEELMVGDTDKAIAETCRQTGALVLEYTVAPIFMDQHRGGHEWIVEFERMPKDLQAFNCLLDDNLQRINSDYEAKRFNSIALEALRLHSVPTGTFLQWMRQRGKVGGQAKVPRLANERKYVDELRKIVL